MYLSKTIGCMKFYSPHLISKALCVIDLFSFIEQESKAEKGTSTEITLKAFILFEENLLQ